MYVTEIALEPCIAPRPLQSRSSRTKVSLLLPILLLAFTLRVAWRIHMGSADFWQNGYSFLYDLATNVVAGKGLCIDGGGCALRAPLYPLFLALTAMAGKNYLWIVLPQALIGTGTVLCAYLIGAQLFGQVTGMLASILTAVYPYYVIHDTALQETSLFTFLTALSVLLLLRARHMNSLTQWLLTGFALGAAVLTRPTLAPFALGVPVWLALFGSGPSPRKMYRVCAVLLPIGLTVGSWLVRNYFVIGAPVLTSETGRYLWLGNNKATFTNYPSESIDRGEDSAVAALSPAEQQQFNALAGHEVQESEWLRKKGLAYIRIHPLATADTAIRKIVAGFSWNFNPVREPLVQTVYFLSYAPILVLGIAGMSLTRNRGRELSLIYLLLLTFAGVTAIFWAHTSHRSYLDVYLIIFSAFALLRLPLFNSLKFKF